MARDFVRVLEKLFTDLEHSGVQDTPTDEWGFYFVEAPGFPDRMGLAIKRALAVNHPDKVTWYTVDSCVAYHPECEQFHPPESYKAKRKGKVRNFNFVMEDPDAGGTESPEDLGD